MFPMLTTPFLLISFLFNWLLSPIKMSLMNMTMKVLGLGSPPVCAFLHVLNYPLIMLVYCHLIESLYPLVVSVEYFLGSKFPAQNLLYFQVQNP